MITAIPMGGTLQADQKIEAPAQPVHVERHKACDSLLFRVFPNGIEMYCRKCGKRILYPWLYLMACMMSEQPVEHTHQDAQGRPKQSIDIIAKQP